MKQGQRVTPPESLAEIQNRTTTSVTSLPTSTRQLHDPTPLPVEISEALQQLTVTTKQRLKTETFSKD